MLCYHILILYHKCAVVSANVTLLTSTKLMLINERLLSLSQKTVSFNDLNFLMKNFSQQF